MSEIKVEDVPARVANLAAWVEAFLRTLSAMQAEPVLVQLDEARGTYDGG
jgi:hypothetical protein